MAVECAGVFEPRIVSFAELILAWVAAFAAMTEFGGVADCTQKSEILGEGGKTDVSCDFTLVALTSHVNV
jgi:hypothetical protein